jgi:hypothetical protein
MPVAEHHPFQDSAAADDPHFRLIDMNAIDEGADVSAPEWHFTTLSNGVQN